MNYKKVDGGVGMHSKKSLKDCVELVENNERCVILEVKPGCEMDLIRLGCFNGNEKMFRLTKGDNHTLTVFTNDAKSYNFGFGNSGYTLISDELRQQKKLIVDCIKLDYAIIVENDSNCKISDSLGMRNPQDIERHLSLAGWPQSHMNIRVNGQFLANERVENVEKWCKDRGYNMELSPKWGRSPVTNCYINEGRLIPIEKERHLDDKLKEMQKESSKEKNIEDYLNHMLQHSKDIVKNHDWDNEDYEVDSLSFEKGYQQAIADIKAYALDEVQKEDIQR